MLITRTLKSDYLPSIILDTPQFSLHTTRETLRLNVPCVEKLEILDHRVHFSPHTLPVKDALISYQLEGQRMSSCQNSQERLNLTYLEPEEEGEVLRHSQAVEQYVVLRTDAKTLTNLIHVCENIVTTDRC